MTKVLIVEDDPLVSRMYQKVLKYEGMEVVSAENGRDGVQAAKDQKPDLILLDIMMPKMNGIEVLEVLKADNGTAGIPVVMLTNLPGTQDAENAMSRGARDYLVKSQFKPKDVAIKVKEILAVIVSQPVNTTQTQTEDTQQNPEATNQNSDKSTEA
jgi:CheY-like chemotaxis protein